MGGLEMDGPGFNWVPDLVAHDLQARGVERPALNPPIERERILVVVKTSKFRWDQRHLGLTQRQLMDHYERQGESSGAILGAHLRLGRVLKDLTAELSPRQFVSITKLDRARLAGRSLIIALGGDDHLKQVSHWIDDSTPVLGVNADPGSSEGNILGCSAAELPGLLRDLERGHYRIEPWTRLRISVDGRDYGPALGEIVLAKRDFRLMSRHRLEMNGETVLQKSSGLLISTGVGSTGWFTSAGLYLGAEAFPRTASYARFELREPHVRFEKRGEGRTAVFPPHVQGVLKPGMVLRVTSLNNSEGIASRDSIDTIPFDRGAVAEIRIDERPLSVVLPAGCGAVGGGDGAIV